jgi:hypothetical protein
MPNFASGSAWEGHQHRPVPNSPLAEPAWRILFGSEVKLKKYGISYMMNIRQIYLFPKIIKEAANFVKDFY